MSAADLIVAVVSVAVSIFVARPFFSRDNGLPRGDDDAEGGN